MQINSNNQTPFGDSYRLLIPKPVGNKLANRAFASKKDVYNTITRALLESHIIVNTPQSGIKMYHTPAFDTKTFEAIDIFTTKEAEEIVQTRLHSKNNNEVEVLQKIKMLSARVPDDNTHIIMKDIDLGQFMKRFIYKDLNIKKDEVLIGQTDAVKHYYK